MAQITIESDGSDVDELNSTYAGLRADLEAAGHQVRFVLPLQARSVQRIAYDVIVHVAGHVDAYAEGAVIASAFRWLRRGMRRPKPRPSVIRVYGPDGLVLREVEVPADDPEDPQDRPR